MKTLKGEIIGEVDFVFAASFFVLFCFNVSPHFLKRRASNQAILFQEIELKEIM